MPDLRTNPSPEHWRRVALLFECMRDSADPLAEAGAEADRQVAEDALRLWNNLERAVSDGFLDKPVELAPPPPQFEIGRRINNRFEIQRLLGIGGMGEVYLAFDHDLNEAVAIKTIRLHLAGDAAVRHRFLAEVQNARRVTHPNVCRINDLFEMGGLPFLSMEYLDGEGLSAWIERRAGPRRAARTLAIQLAEGLAAAHRVGILHCDFKPANVILTGPAASPRAVITDFGLARALRSPGVSPEIAVRSLRGGTLEYMAPELLAGGEPSVATDIFAYGRVLGQLLPKYRIAARCQSARPEDRPASLDPVIRSLRGDLTRRLCLGGGIAVGAAALTRLLTPRPGMPLAGRTRVTVNRVHASEPATAHIFRELLITALRQSTLLTVVADNRLRSLLKSHGQETTLPAALDALASASAGAEIALVIEGALAAVSGGLKASLDVFAPATPAAALSVTEQVSDPRNLVRLADRTALRLRREFGESEAVLRSGRGYTPLEQVTSASPEAVQCYFRALEDHRGAKAASPIPWFDQAVRLDPDFALAWLQRGVSLMSYHLADSFDSFQRAFALRGRVTERERLWIEARYFNIVGDWDSALKTCQRLVALFPEEPDFQREIAFQLTRLGAPKEALPYNQRAVELDSINVNNASEWIVNHTSANLFDEALTLYWKLRQEGETNAMLNWGAGLATMGKDDFDGAYRLFRDMASRTDLDRYSRRLQCGALVLAGRLEESISVLAADLAWDVNNHEQTELNHRRVWLGMLEWMVGAPNRSREYGQASARLDPLPSSLQPLRETGLQALLLDDPDLLGQILERLRVIETRWPSSHTRGARAVLEGAAGFREDPVRANDLFVEARGLRPDPLTLYPIALCHIESGNYAAALEPLIEIENQRGRVHRMYFPGFATLARVHRARCLAQMSRFDESLRLYQWILTNWKPAANLGIVAQVRLEHQQLDRKARERR